MGLLYNLDANLYDFTQSEANDNEIDFYVNLSQIEDFRLSNMLEIGCGTGRLSKHLIKRGINLTGIDISLPMIKIAKDKCANFYLKSNWIAMDVCFPAINNLFDLVIFPNNVFLEINSIDEKSQALITARNLIFNKGRILLDIFNPETANLSRLDGWKRKLGEYQKTNESIRIFIENKVDFNKQLIIINFKIIRKELNSDLISCTQSYIFQTYLFYEQLLDLIDSCNMKVDQKYGDFQMNSFNKKYSKRILLVLRK